MAARTLTSSATRDAYAAGRDIHLRFDTLPFEYAATQETSTVGEFDRGRPVFLQYLNPEIRACYGLRSRPAYTSRQLGQVLHATRLALLVTDAYLIFPASYFFEVPSLAAYLKKIKPLTELGLLQYSSHIMDVQAYAEHKAAEYRKDENNPYLGPTARVVKHDGVIWRPRYSRSTAADIAESWSTAVVSGDLVETARNLAAKASGQDIESMLLALPDRLEGQAFVSRYVRGLIPLEIQLPDVTRLNMFLSREYIASYLTDLDALMVADFTFGDLACGADRLSDALRSRILSARDLDRSLRWVQLFDYIHNGASWTELVALRETPEFAIFFSAAVQPNPRNQLSSASARVRRRIRGVAHSYDDAQRLLALVADEIEAGARLRISDSD